MTPSEKPTANMQKTYHLYPDDQNPGFYHRAPAEVPITLTEWESIARRENAILLIHPSRQEALAAVAGGEPAAVSMQEKLRDALAKAVSRQGFTNEELLAARELLKGGGAL